MDRPALFLLSVACASMLGSGAASACLPPLSRTPAEQIEADLSEQTAAWTSAASVYIGRIDVRRPVGEMAGQPPMPRATGLTWDITLSAEAALMGPLPPGAETLTFTVTPGCVPSDIERGEVGDRFIVYTDGSGPSVRSGMIALNRLRHVETLKAVANAAGAALAPDPPAGAAAAAN